ncbi:MAG: hypothetical protein GWM98_11630 [Nitrospinaceae bacterium]|nr:hypothetical protein [Nitrospinaceae bacterium]NIR55034.1 hypothetical protein [Nitrospinaceae bacterium]NIS85433.1 hypothetical protein [Nitrospinaceae bacterium]NIT82272.1 hypothetical protein [Nitrospinaceae bacterium]NIU44502.1 hypothetical protein [Nitrospinaceae bacterium]
MKSVGCAFALTELVSASSTGEIPDAIGWKGGISILVECKTTRADFLSDKNKLFRQHPHHGMGRHRYYMTLPEAIKSEDLPENWGLLYVYENNVRRIYDPRKQQGSSYWPGIFENSQQAEIDLLCSALRRVHIRGDLKKIYETLAPEAHRP